MINALQEYLIEKGGRPHWGKANNKIFEHPSALKGCYNWNKWLINTINLTTRALSAVHLAKKC
jgi:hypothetical protein